MKIASWVTAIGIALVSSSSALAQVSFSGTYSNDFNSDISGWSETGQGDGTINDAAPADWGGSAGIYWTPDLGDGDRSLSMYKTAVGETHWAEIDFVNDGAAITQLDFTYDLESHWTRFADNGREGILKFELDVNGGGFNEIHASMVHDDSQVTSGNDATWLDDSTADGFGLIDIDQMFSAAVDIASGDNFTIRFGNLGDEGLGGSSRNMNIGIDNLSIADPNAQSAPIPEPTTIAMWTLLGLIGVGFGYRQVRKAK